MSTLNGAADNRLLAALPKSDRRRILAGCDTVQLGIADVLYVPWQPLTSVYFPTSSFMSLIMPTPDSAAFEVGLVGNEGMVGISLVLDGDLSPERAVVLGAGSALRMDAAFLRRQLGRSESRRRRLSRYVHVRISQLAQAAVCAHFHLLEARLARRLLMTQDRSRASTLNAPQEILASKRGGRRVGVTKAASALQHRRLIHYSRGDITVLDRRGLMAAACRCYKSDRDSYDRLRSA